METVTLPKAFIDELITTVHAHADAMHTASELSSTTAKLLNQTEQCQDSLKRLSNTLDKTSGELFDIAMTIKVVAYGADEVVESENDLPQGDDVTVVDHSWWRAS